MWNARLDEAQAGINITGRNINIFRYANDTTLMAQSEEELKNLLMRKEESEKAGLKLNIKQPKIIWSHHFMENKRGKSGSSDRLYFLDGDCSHEIKRLAPWKESSDKPWTAY